jgi:hypothetical protein
VPIRKTLQTFWWYRDGRIGGMAQPGFNELAAEGRTFLGCGPRSDALAFDEVVVIGWLAKLTARPRLSELQDHLEWTRTRVVPFLEQDVEKFERDVEPLARPEGVLDTLDRVARHTGLIESARAAAAADGGTAFELELRPERIQRELDALGSHGIDTVLNLTEQPPHSVVEASDLTAVHVAVDDLHPPTRAQVEHVAEVLERAERDGSNVAVHCFAGVGRTSTMLMATELLAGASLDALVAHINERNPRCLFKGSQWEFLQELAADVAGERRS